MKYWQSLIFAEPEQHLELARCAELLGLAGLVLPDHVALPEQHETHYPYSDYELDPGAPFLDPWPAITAMAAVTTRLRFATYVYVLPMRDPFSVAKSVGTAAILSDHRVALGLGVGWLREEVELLGHAFEGRGRRSDEMIEIMRRLWTDGEAEFQGEFYAFDRVQARPAPGRPVPIYVGGHSPAALRRAAQSDGWMALDLPEHELGRLIAAVRRARRDAGAPEDGYEIFFGPSQPPAREQCRRWEDLGVTSLILPAWAMLSGDYASLDSKRDWLERQAEALL